MRLALILSVMMSGSALAAEPITGRWLTDSKDGVVEIAPCGRSLCGRLAKMLVAPKGPAVDRNNPDPALRTRPLIGLPILTGFVGDGAVWRGTAYDPKVGKSYNTTLQRVGADQLKVRGCVMVFCRTVTWSRAP